MKFCVDGKHSERTTEPFSSVKYSDVFLFKSYSAIIKKNLEIPVITVVEFLSV